MNIIKRINTTRLIGKIHENEEYCRKLGIMDISIFRNVPVNPINVIHLEKTDLKNE